jgi:hypothetical protein
MAVPVGNFADEIKRLQRCINDLVSVLAFPAMWSGGGPTEIVNTLPAVLLELLRLDLVYVRIKGPVDGVPLEIVRFAQSRKLVAGPEEVDKVLNRSTEMASGGSKPYWRYRDFDRALGTWAAG